MSIEPSSKLFYSLVYRYFGLLLLVSACTEQKLIEDYLHDSGATISVTDPNNAHNLNETYIQCSLFENYKESQVSDSYNKEQHLIFLRRYSRDMQSYLECNISLDKNYDVTDYNIIYNFYLSSIGNKLFYFSGRIDKGDKDIAYEFDYNPDNNRVGSKITNIPIIEGDTLFMSIGIDANLYSIKKITL